MTRIDKQEVLFLLKGLHEAEYILDRGWNISYTLPRLTAVRKMVQTVEKMLQPSDFEIVDCSFDCVLDRNHCKCIHQHR